MVVLAFYTGNDVFDTINMKFFTLEDGKLTRIKPELTDAELEPLKAKAWLRRNFFVFAFLTEKLSNLQASLKGGTFRNDFEMLRKDYPPELEEGWVLSKAILKELVRATKAAGAEPVLVVIPTDLQYGQEKWQETVEMFGLRESDFDLKKPEQRLQAFAAENGVPYVDLLPALAEENRKQALHLPLNGHWNACGHGVAAAVISEALIEKGIV